MTGVRYSAPILLSFSLVTSLFHAAEFFLRS